MKIHIAYTLSQNKSVLYTEFHENRCSRSPVMPAQTDRQTDRQKRISKMWFSFSAHLIIHVGTIYFQKSKITNIFGLQIYLYKDLIDLTLLQDTTFTCVWKVRDITGKQGTIHRLSISIVFLRYVMEAQNVRFFGDINHEHKTDYKYIN